MYRHYPTHRLHEMRDNLRAELERGVAGPAKYLKAVVKEKERVERELERREPRNG